MKTQMAMFWDSHNHQAHKNRMENLELCRKARFLAVKAWREAGADEARWEEFTAAADEALETAEKIMEERIG